jgi:hypothetical protein
MHFSDLNVSDEDQYTICYVITIEFTRYLHEDNLSQPIFFLTKL